MSRYRRRLPVVACATLLAQTAVAAPPADNLLRNGGFESGDSLWWRRPGAYAGSLDTTLRHSGIACWRMDLPGSDHEVTISHSGRLQPADGYQLSVFIRCRDVHPAAAISIRALQFAAGKPTGWVMRGKQADLVHTGGSHDWYRFSVNIAAGLLNAGTEALAIFLRGAAGATGTVWFDDTVLRPYTGKPPAEQIDAQAAPPLRANQNEGGVDDAAAFRDIPFLRAVGKGVVLDCGRDDNLFYGPEPAVIRLRLEEVADGQCEWMVSDYHGRKVQAGRASHSTTIRVPEMGYFEVAAKLRREDEVVGAVRTSFAHLPAKPEVAADYCFGSWVQQSDLLDDIGARWTRVGTGWRYLEPKPGQWNEGLWSGMDNHLRQLVQQGIRPIFLFAKVPSWAGPDYKRVAPEHWDDFRAFVRRCVERYRDAVDVWEVMNEPYIPALFHGTLEEVLQWHRIVHQEVRRGDPEGKVIGPCLNTRKDNLFAEMEQLLQRGLGELVDGISIHTYGGLEADGLLEDFSRLRELLRRYHAGKPLYITEQGLSVPEELPLERWQAQYLARMILLCKQADVRAVIWHMMSWPQGGTEEQRNFAIVRARTDSKQRAPRPAFVAAATVSAVIGTAHYLGPLKLPGQNDGTVIAQVYDRGTEEVLAIWDWGRPDHDLVLAVNTGSAEVVHIDGRRQRVAVKDGRLPLTIGPDPVFVVLPAGSQSPG